MRDRIWSSTGSARSCSRASTSRPRCSSRARGRSDGRLTSARRGGPRQAACSRPARACGAALRRARLYLPARSRGADRGAGAVRALHVNYGLRRAAPMTSATAPGCADASVSRSRCTARRPPRGNLQAWARRERYETAAALAGGADVAAGHTATDQVETILYRLASSPSRRALLGMQTEHLRGGEAGPAASFITRASTGEYCRSGGSSGETTRPTSSTCSRAAACAASWCRRCARFIPPPRTMCWRWRRSSATRRTCSTSSWTRR